MGSGSADIRIDSATDDELRALARWLRDEDEFRGRVSFVDAAMTPGQMGGLADALTVIITSGTATTLFSSLFTWLARRKEANIVSLKLRNRDGRELELKCGSADDAQRTLDQVRTLFGDGA